KSHAFPTRRWTKPIWPNSFTSTAVRASSGCRSRWFSSVVLPAPRKPVSTVTGVVSAMGMAIQRVGRHLRCRDLDQPAIPSGSEEAIAASGMAGDAALIHQQQQGVAVAIDTQFLQVLGLAGRLTLAPQPRPAAAEVADL